MASTTDARTHPDVVQPATTTVSTRRIANQGDSAVPKNALGALLAHDQLSVSGSELRHDLGERRRLRELEQRRRLQREYAGVAAILRIDHARVRHWPSEFAREGQQRRGRRDRLRDIAAAEDVRVGKSHLEIDDEQSRRATHAQPTAETLPHIDIQLVHAAKRACAPTTGNPGECGPGECGAVQVPI